MFSSLMQYSDVGFYILRFVVAIIFIRHALPKIKAPQHMAQGMGWPKGAVIFLGLVELLSGIGFILGIYVQVAATLLSLVMLGAIRMKMFTWHVPFTTTTGTGWEFDLVLLASNILIFLSGGGSVAIIHF